MPKGASELAARFTADLATVRGSEDAPNGAAAIQGAMRPLCVPDLGWAVSDFVGSFQGAGSVREFGTHEHGH
jgi:hypothetical protein